MEFLKNFFDYSPHGNLRDGFLHEWLLAFVILAAFGLIGLFLGWLMWRNCKKRCDLIMADNERIRKKSGAA